MELGLDPDQIPAEFSLPGERNRHFQEIEKKQVRDQKKKLGHLLNHERKTQFQVLRERLEKTLFHQGFTGVSTPIVLTSQALAKMGIDQRHPLSRQIYRLSQNRCLRPMLAPGLYSLMRNFSRLRHRPIRFFEIGSCFRKESNGSRHCNEFTMLNFVEMGLSETDRYNRLKTVASMVMKAVGIDEYYFDNKDSKIYGSTLDVMAGPRRIEVASGAMGPHPLDHAWGITDNWVGMGFGVERLLMISNGDASIGRWARNLAYLDGICLNI